MKTLAILLALVPVMAAAREKDDFKSILKRVEQHYGKNHTHIPLLGLVTLASHFTRPLGASDFKLAVIEGVGSRSESFQEFAPGAAWHPFIRTTSRSGEHVVLYGRDEGHAIRTLMVVVDKDEAVVMQMRLNPTHFAKFVAEKSRRD